MADVEEPFLGEDSPEVGAEVYKDMLFVYVTPEEVAETNPFDSDSYCAEVGKEVNLAQLAEEIGVAVGFNVQLSLMNPRPEVPVSPENPSKLYVNPPIDGRIVRGRINSHRINDDYGFTEEQLRRRELLAKLRSGEELSSDETRDAMLLLLTQG